jgi:hypothetical protein
LKRAVGAAKPQALHGWTDEAWCGREADILR